MVWPALIGAGASLIGSIFGSKSKKQETTTTSHVDYRRMVREAEAAGFNPLTALRNGGAAGFSVSTSTTPAAPLSARLADGVQSGVNAFLQNFDPHADTAREQQARLIDAQVRNLNASTAELTARHAVTARGNGALANRGQSDVDQMLKEPPNPARFGGVLTPEIGTPEATNPWPRDWGLIIDPNTANAEQYEDRYGEFLGSIIGSGVTLYKDGKANILPALKNLPPPPLPDWLLYGNSNKRPRLKPPR